MAEDPKNEGKHKVDRTEVTFENLKPLGILINLRLSNAAQPQVTENIVFIRQPTLVSSRPAVASGPMPNDDRMWSALISMSIISKGLMAAGKLGPEAADQRLVKGW